MLEDNWETLMHLSVNAVLGYVVSWMYFAVAFLILKGLLGKTKAALLAYVTSYLVWLGVTAFLQVKAMH